MSPLFTEQVPVCRRYAVSSLDLSPERRKNRVAVDGVPRPFYLTPDTQDVVLE